MESNENIVFDHVMCMYNAKDNYIISARYCKNPDVWLYGEISMEKQRLLGFDCEYPPTAYYNEEEEYVLDEEDAMDDYRKDPPSGYPTWQQIIDAVKDENTELLADRTAYDIIPRILKDTGHDLNEPCNKTFEQVTCEYTGGNIWIFSALYNGWRWLYGPVDQYINAYDINGEEIYRTDQDYEAHERRPCEGYPTWQQIIDAVKANCEPGAADEVEAIIKETADDLSKPCNT